MMGYLEFGRVHYLKLTFVRLMRNMISARCPTSVGRVVDGLRQSFREMEQSREELLC